MQVRELTTKLGFELDLTQLKRAETAIANYKKMAMSLSNKLNPQQSYNRDHGRALEAEKRRNQAIQNSYTKAHGQALEADKKYNAKLTKQNKTSAEKRLAEEYKVTQQVERNKDKLTRKEQANARREVASRRRVTRAWIEQNNAIINVANSMTKIAIVGRNIGIGLLAGIVYPMQRMVRTAGRSAMEFDRMTASLGVLIGEDKVGGFMKNLRNFAIETPLDLQTITKASNLLIGVGVETEKIVDKMQMFGDLTKGNNDEFSRIVLQYQQAVAKGKPNWDEIKRFGEAGVPVLQALTEVLKVNKEGVMKLSKQGAISIEDFDNALKLLHQTKFKGMMTRIMEDFGGQLSKSRGLVEQIGIIFMKDWFPFLTKALKAVNGVLEMVAKIPRPLRMGMVILAGSVVHAIGLFTFLSASLVVVTQLASAYAQLNTQMGIGSALQAGGGIAGMMGNFVKILPKLKVIGLFFAKKAGWIGLILTIVTSLIWLVKKMNNMGVRDNGDVTRDSLSGRGYTNANNDRNVNLTVNSTIEAPEGTQESQRRYLEDFVDKRILSGEKQLVSNMKLNTTGGR